MMNMSPELVKIAMARHHNELVYIKDKHSRFIDGNDTFLSFFGFSHIEQAYHKSDYDLPCPDYAQQYIKDDQETMENGELQVIEFNMTCHGEIQVLLTNKYQICLEGTNTSAVMGISRTINKTAISQFLSIVEHNHFNQLKISHVLFKNKVNDHASVPLTERELDVLYYMLHGLSQKQIANNLKLSVRTIEDHVEPIKAKLECGNKNQLFEFALHYGILNIIPKHLV